MIKVDCDYNIKEDIGFLLETEKINSIELSERAKVSRTTFDVIQKKVRPGMMFVKKYMHMLMRTNIELT